MGQLEAKLSETIPLLPTHKECIKKKNTMDLITFVDKVDINNMNLSTTAPQRTRTNENSPFLGKLHINRQREDADSLMGHVNGLRGLSPMRTNASMAGRHKSLTSKNRSGAGAKQKFNF